MNWVNGTPDGSGEESIERITMLRNTLGQFVPPVCECLGLLDFNDVTIFLDECHTYITLVF